MKIQMRRSGEIYACGKLIKFSRGDIIRAREFGTLLSTVLTSGCASIYKEEKMDVKKIENKDLSQHIKINNKKAIKRTKKAKKNVPVQKNK